MSIDILGSMNSIFGGPVTRQASAFLGESEENTGTGLRSSATTLLAGLMRNTTEPGGAASLFRSVTGSSVDAGFENKLTNVVANRGSLEPIFSQGEGLIGSVFGNHAGSVAHALSQVSSVKPSSAMSLLAMAAPAMFGLLKRHVTQGNMDAGGLTSLLLSQKGSLQRAGLDSRITNAMGVGSLQNLLGSLPEPQRDRERIAEPASTSYIGPGTTGRTAAPTVVNRERRWIPWAVGLGAAALAFAFLTSRMSRDHQATRTAQTTVPAQPQTSTQGEFSNENAPDRSANAQDNTANNATNTQPNSSSSMHLAEASPARVYFSVGEAVIDPANRKVIEEVAETVKSSGTPVQVTGYADQSGNTAQNQALAKSRATAVHDALVTQGVPENNIKMQPPQSVTGTGSDAEARRVDITVAEAPQH